MNDRTYAVSHTNAFSPALRPFGKLRASSSRELAAWYVPLYLYFGFALYERKTEMQKKMKCRINMEAIRGALAFLTVREGITVLQVSDATETAAMLRIMARHAQECIGQPVSLREPRPQIEELYASYLVEGLPGVGPRRARMLLAHFGSPAAIMCAAAEELSQVPGKGGTQGAAST
jgi:ERCC4-type nuclease